MIQERLNVFLYIATFCFFICIFYLIKKKTLSLKYSLMWLLSGLAILVIIIFPEAFSTLMNMLGVVNPSNGLFAICIFLFMVMLLILTSVISKMNNKIEKLTQNIGILEKKIRDMSNEVDVV